MRLSHIITGSINTQMEIIVTYRLRLCETLQFCYRFQTFRWWMLWPQPSSKCKFVDLLTTQKFGFRTQKANCCSYRNFRFHGNWCYLGLSLRSRKPTSSSDGDVFCTRRLCHLLPLPSGSTGLWRFCWKRKYSLELKEEKKKDNIFVKSTAE